MHLVSSGGEGLNTELCTPLQKISHCTTVVDIFYFFVRIELTASNTSLQQKFKTKCDEVETLTTDKQKLTAALDTAAAGKKQMEANLASAAQEKDALVQVKTSIHHFKHLFLQGSIFLLKFDFFSPP